ncbi:DMT family transporter [Helicobacter pametensis]|uniref:DMT family transporter n=1 Tax=Helicobacter pametensis TaxID=95149 RepID=UPI000489260A|nr:multidrug efflux SMR transporter [Helicobacter pametensis]
MKLRSWCFLILAILTEVLATSLLKLFEGDTLGYLVVFALIGVSYYFMALSLRSIPVGVAYGMWEVLGVSCIVAIGVFFYGEILSTAQAIGLSLAILGIILVNLGHKEDHA